MLITKSIYVIMNIVKSGNQKRRITVMASRELELVRRMEKEAWLKLRKASELYEMGDRRVLRLRARWSAISDVLDELEEMEEE